MPNGLSHWVFDWTARVEELFIPIQRKSGIPLYLQIKNGIRVALHNQPRRESFVLPPQRDLAAKLGVSRNTVSMAYGELEREGIVASQVGKGTVVVSPSGKMESRSRHEQLTKTIEHSVEEALAMGFTLEEYADTVGEFLREKREMLRHIRLIFVECNKEQLFYFSEHLSLEPGVVITPVLLTDIRERPERWRRELRSADMVVTSFYHIDELEALLSGSSQPLVGINLQPEMSTIVRIARIAKGAVVGLVAASKQFLAEMGSTLREVEIGDERVRGFTGDDPEELEKFVDGCGALVVSPSRRSEVAELAGRKPVVEFLFAPDDASVNNIRVALLEAKRLRRGKEGDGSADNGADVS